MNNFYAILFSDKKNGGEQSENINHACWRSGITWNQTRSEDRQSGGGGQVY